MYLKTKKKRVLTIIDSITNFLKTKNIKCENTHAFPFKYAHQYTLYILVILTYV